MIAVLLALASAADGDEVGGFVLGQAVSREGLECRGDVCQKRAEVAGQPGTYAVSLCNGIAKTVVFSVPFAQDTATTRDNFGGYLQLVSEPRTSALALWASWSEALAASDFVRESERVENTLPWMRVVKPPHARLLRVSEHEVGGVVVFTTSLVASATDPSCPAP